MEARRRRSSVPCTYQFTFEGGLQSNVRAQIINELFKYILFERQQIPMTFDQIKRDQENEIKAQLQQKNDLSRKKMSLQSRMQSKKATDLVSKLDDAFQNIFRAFDTSPEVQKAAVVIGATPVSPKEIYLVELPPLSPDADNLSARTCIKSMFHQLIKLDPLGRLSQIHPTNTSVLLYAPRHSNLQWFYPKPQYKIPLRGKQFRFQLQSSCKYGNHNLSNNFSIVDLSGFEPLDSSVEDMSMVSDIAEEEARSSSSKSSITADYVCVESDQEFDVIESTAIVNEISLSNEQDVDADCSKLSAASSKGSNKSYITTSEIFTRTSALTRSLAAGCTESPTCLSEQSISEHETGHSCINEGVDMTAVSSEQDFIWYQSPVYIKGYRDKFTKSM